MEHNKNKTTIPDATIDSSDAAHLLTELLGGAPRHWITWLSNDRRRSRRLRPAPDPGRPRYHLDAVRAFADVELRRRSRALVHRHRSRGEQGTLVSVLAGGRLLSQPALDAGLEHGHPPVTEQAVTMQIETASISFQLAPGAAWQLGRELCTAAAAYLPGGTPEDATRVQS